MWWLKHHFEQRHANLLKRAKIIKTIRDFFDSDGFLAVETPVLQVMPTADTHIHGFATELHDIALKSLKTLYLHTSPELAMKKLLVAGLDKIYQIGPVFRNGESTPLHTPEFTMIEWYRVGGDYTVLMEDCVNLLRQVVQAAQASLFRHHGRVCDPFKPWQRLSVAQAFSDYAHVDLADYLDSPDRFRSAIDALGIRTAADDGWDDLFFRVMAERIEPFLGYDQPTILYDYPAILGALARRKPDDPRWVERFELYVCGVELANAFSELTDADEQRARMVRDMAEKHRIYGYTYAPDEDFLAALDHGLPDCAGIALGIDRLVMLACGAGDIADVLWTGRL
jgi:lysyl-tRNA synthetase class 2